MKSGRPQRSGAKICDANQKLGRLYHQLTDEEMSDVEDSYDRFEVPCGPFESPRKKLDIKETPI